MRELSILTFATLDGVMQAPVQAEEDPSGGFQHGGWSARFLDQVMPQVEEEAMAKPFDLLFGRKTYDLFAGHWPKVSGNTHGEKLNKATKYVATSTLSGLDWTGTIPIAGDIAEEVLRLKEKDGPLLQVHGSSQLIQTLLANDLIDEFRLWTFPVVVGPGKRLFGEGVPPTDLKLVKSRPTENGVVMSIYRRAGRHGG